MTRIQMYEGGCLCGDIRFKIHGTPSLIEYCHCRSCRKAVGAPVMAWVGISKQRFKLVRGTLGIYASSPDVERGFCKNCGTSITQFSTEFPDDVYVSNAAIDDAASFPPEVHIWRSERLSWFDTNDALPRYTRFKSDGILEVSTKEVS